MKVLFVTDTHFTMAARDEYRWALFPWLIQQAKKNKVDAIAWGGDLTDAKDRHASTLVNRLMENFITLTQLEQIPLIMIVGNHDYIEPTNPFFKFISCLPNVTYIIGHALIPVGQGDDMETILCVSHRKDGFKSLKLRDVEYQADVVLAHQTFNGAIGSNGFALEGEAQSSLRKFTGKILSGDIHKPQTLGRVTYIGSPYRVHFDDTFKPRCILYNHGKLVDLHFPCLYRWTVEIQSPKELLKVPDLCEGDQVKIRLYLSREQFAQWKELSAQVRSYAEELKLEVFGIELKARPEKRARVVDETVETKPQIQLLSPKETLLAFAKQENLSEDYIQAGVDLL